MKIKNPNVGALSNFEVLDFLNARGAGKDISRVMAPVAPSEYKVYDYLVGTPASRQTRDQINEFKLKCEKFNLAKAEILSIINLTPYELSGLDPVNALIVPVRFNFPILSLYSLSRLNFRHASLLKSNAVCSSAPLLQTTSKITSNYGWPKYRCIRFSNY